MRGRGWLSNFSVGNPARGSRRAARQRVPLGHRRPGPRRQRCDRGNRRRSPSGTLSNPRPRDDNGGRQIAGRVALHPVPGLIVGGSGARGAFVSQIAVRAALGETDVRGLHADRVGRRRRVFARLLSASGSKPWSATGRCRCRARPRASCRCGRSPRSAEGRYKMRPGLYAAAPPRSSRLQRDRDRPRPSQTWDAPVTRATVGGGYSIQRNLVLKAEFQLNTRDGGRVRTLSPRRRAAGVLVLSTRTRADARRRLEGTAVGDDAEVGRHAAVSLAGHRVHRGVCGPARCRGLGFFRDWLFAVLGGCSRDRPDPRPRRAAPGAAGGRAASQRVRSRRGQPPDAAGPVAVGRLSRNRAARRVRADRNASRGHGSAQRNVRPPRARRSPTGTTVDFPNSDRIYHNVFSLSKTEPFDLGRYADRPLQVGPVRPRRVSCACSARSTRT